MLIWIFNNNKNCDYQLFQKKMDVWNVLNYLQHQQAGLRENYNNLLSLVGEITKKLQKDDEKLADRIQVKAHSKCKYYNRGFCKEEKACEFSHPLEICEEFLDSGICTKGRACKSRHPHKCRFWSNGYCWRAENCVYLHKEEDFAKESDNDQNSVEDSNDKKSDDDIKKITKS